MRILLAAALLLAGCTRDLALPAAPTAIAVEVAALSVDHGFAGDTVTLEGRGFGASPSDVRVTFGGSSPVNPEEARGDRLVVVVPDDATSGPVVVESPLGRASAPAFTFDGLGTPRAKRVSLARDLRPAFQTAFPMGERLFVADASVYDQAAIVGRGTRTSLGLRDVVEAVRMPDGGVLVLDADETDRPATARCGGHLTRLDAQGAMTGTLALWRNDGNCLRFNALAVGFDGRYAAALAFGAVALVDLADGAVTYLQTGEWLESIAAIGNDRFLAGAMLGVVRVALDGGTWTATTPEIVADDRYDLSIAVAGRADGVGALFTDTGELVLFDATKWPPEIVAHGGFPWQRNQQGRLALSADGLRMALSLPGLDRVTTFDVGDGRLVPLGSVVVERPQRLEPDAGGLFFVGARGAMVAVSQETGALVDAVPVTAGLGWPVVRQTAEGPVVELAASRFDRVLRFDLASLQPLEAAPMYRVPTGARMQTVVAAGRILFVSVVGAVLRLEEDGTTAPARYLGPDAEGLMSMEASTDGSLLLVAVQAGEDQQLALLATAPWTGEALATLPAPDLLHAASDGRLLVLVFEQRIEVHDVAALRAGAADSRVREVALPEGALAEAGEGALVRGRLLLGVKTAGETERRLAVVDPATGALTLGGLLHRDAASGSLVVSPSGRHVFWTEMGEEGERFLDRRVDPASGAVLGGRAPVVLAPGGAGLALAPDGEHVFVVEQDADRLVLVE